MITDNNPEIAVLKNQMFTLLVALIVVSGTLTVYLYRQVSMSNKDIAQTQQMMTLVDQRDAAMQGAVTTFINRLVNYGEKHPEFVPLLKKYNIAPVPGVPAMSGK